MTGARDPPYSQSHCLEERSRVETRKIQVACTPRLKSSPLARVLHDVLTRHRAIVHNDSLLQCHFNKRGQAPATNYRFVDRPRTMMPESISLRVGCSAGKASTEGTRKAAEVYPALGCPEPCGGPIGIASGAASGEGVEREGVGGDQGRRPATYGTLTRQAGRNQPRLRRGPNRD